MRRILWLVVALLLPGLAYGATLDNVRARGVLSCGVNVGLAGFSLADSQGVWRGLDVDMCRAVAAAVLGDATKIKYVPLTSQNRFTALQSGEVDMLSRNTTHTFVRDATLGLRMVGVSFYDGQGFVTRKSIGAKKVADLNGGTICMLAGSTHELNIGDYFRANNLTFKPVVLDTQDTLVTTFSAGRCDAITQDASNIASMVATGLPAPSDQYQVIAERISKEPLGPMIRRGDDQWLDITRWTLLALIEAEELGVTAANADKMLAESASATTQRLLGKTGDFGKALGLDNAWALNALRQVGNYGEIYDRNVGPNSPMKLPRAQNDLWTRGGLLYAIPFR
ncbi:MAG: amino acid ABC transporter substrate-binding protein [Acetobacteraceae bacterium]|nr:amino acid ABC transporter substrate-binding protein [Acetobacteraceae bacterium]